VTDALPALVRRLRRLEKLETDFAGQLEKEKLLAMKELAYGAGHEINNPLANISSRAQTLLRQETDPDNRRKLATINAQAFRAHEMIADMMLFASPPPLELRSLRVDPLIDEVIDQLKPVAQAQGTRIEREVVESLPDIEADPVQIQVALQAICANSLEALGYGGQVQINALAETTDGVHAVAVRIRDTGPGIPPDVRRHLFDPFYSGREAGRGLGFGLSKAWTIVTAHGGRIEVESDAEVGATLLVRLPVRLPCDVKRQGAG
jgi:signal transduction histidine kinase